MKKLIIVSLLLTCTLLLFAAERRDINLPEPDKISGMDVLQAIETRAASRRYDGSIVPLKAISAILWAGNGIILKEGNKTVHGYDTVSGATPGNRYSTPWGWGKPYLKLYLLLKNGAYEYLPEEHKLKFITDRNLMRNSGSGGSNAFGVIVIAADFDKMPGSNSDVKNVAFLSAGSAAQNMYIAGAAYGIQMLTQVSIKHDELKTKLNMPNKMEPLTILSFGYSK